MDNSEKYEMLAEGEIGLPSLMGILPDSASFQFNKESIERNLSKHKDFKLLSFQESKDLEPDDSLQRYSATIHYKQYEFDVEITVVDVQKLNLRDYGFANSIDEKSLASASEQRFMLETSLYFNNNALESFHLQLKIMDAIVPDASLVADFTSYRLLSAKWIRLAATSSVPPSPDYIYTIHGVYEEKENEGKRQYWLHTHGLLRCGSVELEILNIEQDPELMNTLINMSVKRFLSEPAKENEKFTIGYDGLGINLMWMRWEEALKEMPEEMLGGMNDRNGENNFHAEPSGILFAVEDEMCMSPLIYSKTISENPVFYITTEETNRMSALAKERFPYFERIFLRKQKRRERKPFFKKIFSKTKEEEAAWSFLVKFGLTTDGSEPNSEKEHLWFEVLSIKGKNIEGKLMNRPYWINKLKEGDTATYPIDMLTDWVIYTPEETFTPDAAYLMD